MRKHQRTLRRENRGDMIGIELDDVSLKTMNDTIRHLIRRFQELEKPFLEEGSSGIRDAPNHRTRTRRRNSSLSPPHYDHAAYSSPPEKGDNTRNRARSRHGKDNFEDEAEEDAFWAQRTQYAKFTLRRRLIWLSKKSEAQYLFETLSRVQIRRIARQVGGMAVMMHEYGCGTLELNEAVRRIDERVSRVMGVRRVE